MYREIGKPTFTPAQPIVCKGASVSLQASGGVNYEWLPATDLSDAAIANPVASPAQSSSYKVKVTDDLGCKNTGDITITVIQPVTISVTGDTDICQGESVNLKAGGAEAGFWQYVHHLSLDRNLFIQSRKHR